MERLVGSNPKPIEPIIRRGVSIFIRVCTQHTANLRIAIASGKTIKCIEYDKFVDNEEPNFLGRLLTEALSPKQRSPPVKSLQNALSKKSSRQKPKNHFGGTLNTTEATDEDMKEIDSLLAETQIAMVKRQGRAPLSKRRQPSQKTFIPIPPQSDPSTANVDRIRETVLEIIDADDKKEDPPTILSISIIGDADDADGMVIDTSISATSSATVHMPIDETEPLDETVAVPFFRSIIELGKKQTVSIVATDAVGAYIANVLTNSNIAIAVEAKRQLPETAPLATNMLEIGAAIY